MSTNNSKKNTTRKTSSVNRNTKKTTSRKRRTSSKNRKKNGIPLEKALVFCLSVMAICTLIYFFSDYIKLKKTVSQSQNVEKIENPQKKDTPKIKNENQKAQNKNSSKKTAVPSIKKETKTVQPKKEETKKNNNSEKFVNQKTEKKSVGEEKAKTENSVKKTQNPSKNVEKSVQKKTKFDFPLLPVAQNHAELAFVFDDAGQNLSQVEKCLSVPFKITVAVLPKLPYSVQAAEIVRKSGNEVILHQPMQSVDLSINPGNGALKPGMNEDEVRAILFENINEVGPVFGFNNHEGSLVTADAEIVSYIMKFASECGIFFLDSRTNVETKVPFVASSLGYSYYERNIFLDNTQNPDDIIKEIVKGLNIANKKGGAILIGHVWSSAILPEILKEIYPLLKEKGYTFTTVSNFKGIQNGF